tara:strand:+ start:113 stop:283 length:171 start_codon:yes stop_codon:yes gene_type:complete
MSWNNILRNENRLRKKSGRARSKVIDSMTPQGQAVYCNREIENAYGYATQIKKEKK